MNNQTGKDMQTGNRANGQVARASVGSDFRSQVYWLKAQTFAEHIAALIVELPRDRAADVIGNQLLRAATSIGANIAEGYGRFSQPAFRNHLSIARGSAFEAESWLDLLHRRKYITPKDFGSLLKDCVEIQKLVTLRMKSLTDGKTYAARETPAPPSDD